MEVVTARSSSLLRSLPLWLRLAGASLLSALAFFLTFSLGLPAEGATYLLLFPTVLAAAYLAGRDAGIAATGTAAVLLGGQILLSWNEDMHALTQFASLLVFILIGVGTAVLLSRVNQTLRELETANAELQHASDAARSANEETDLLLRELRHRVRNDISNLIAILRLQARRCEPSAAEHLVAAADRLQVLAKVHRRLSRQGHSPVVEMKGFINELCGELRSTMLALKPVALQTEVEPMELPSTRAVSIGLIVNELVTNSTKYAFPGERGGSIWVEMRCDGNEIDLSVCDDGVGMRTNAVDNPEGSGLGHQLVRSLSAQLGGGFECIREPGATRCRVRFPAEPTTAAE